LAYKNKGNQTLSGDAILVFNNSLLDFVSASVAPTLQNGANFSWSFANLLPFENRSISLVFNVNSPLETPPVNIGDSLIFNAFVPVLNDENPTDNNFTYNQTVVGSFDPNEIICLEGQSVAPSEIGKYLHYVINFENTGNFPAENVVVKTIIDPAKFDINSLQLLDTSSPVDARITGNVVEFIFKNVQLAGPGGHGHVLLKVKSKNTLIAGDSVANRADIFFDYNAPVDTGLVSTVFQSLSNSVFVKDDSVSVSPNPTTGNVNINSNFNINKVELYDVQGRIIETHIGTTKTLDISDKSNGVYFLKISTEKGSKIEKIVKE
jgi:Secretion system C-terminal sorting domain